jgi:hypothetical protein
VRRSSYLVLGLTTGIVACAPSTGQLDPSSTTAARSASQRGSSAPKEPGGEPIGPIPIANPILHAWPASEENTVFASNACIESFALDASHVYVVQSATGITKTAKTGVGDAVGLFAPAPKTRTYMGWLGLWGDRVYYTADDGLFRMNKRGGDRVLVARGVPSGGLAPGWAPLLDSSGVYWFDGSSSALSLHAIEHDSKRPRLVFRQATSDVFIDSTSLRMDRDSLFWLRRGPGEELAIERVAKRGGAVIVVARSRPGERALLVNGDGAPGFFPIDGGVVVQTSSGADGDIRFVSPSREAILLDKASRARLLSADETSAYWTTWDDHVLHRRTIDGRPAEIVFRPDADLDGALATRERVVFVNANGVLEVANDGGGVRWTGSEKLQGASQIVADENYLYVLLRGMHPDAGCLASSVVRIRRAVALPPGGAPRSAGAK